MASTIMQTALREFIERRQDATSADRASDPRQADRDIASAQELLQADVGDRRAMEDTAKRFDSIVLTLHTENGDAVSRFGIEGESSFQRAADLSAAYMREGKPHSVTFE